MANERTQDHATTATTLKRRGILAAAGAVVAGLVARQISQPVAAAPTPGTNFIASSGSGTAYDITTGGYSTGVSATGSNYGVYSSVGSGYGVFAVTIGSGSTGRADVYGGAGGAGNYGVRGEGTTGVSGQSDGGIGVSGTIPAYVGLAPPVVNTAANTIAVEGTNSSSGTRGIGVRGDSTNDTGVYGTGKNYGVRGDAGSGAGAARLLGVATTANAVALGSVVVAPATIAGYFNGEVHVHGGAFVVDDMTMKHGTVSHPDGTKRLMYSMEAPESWIEDFGKATLVNGITTIAIDTDFAAVAHMDDFHVFLSEYDGNNSLYVTKQSANGFEVHAKSGTGNGTFSYRVVAKPNVGRKVERMPEYRLPFDAGQFMKTAMEQTVKDVSPQPPKKKS